MPTRFSNLILHAFGDASLTYINNYATFALLKLNE